MQKPPECSTRSMHTNLLSCAQAQSLPWAFCALIALAARRICPGALPAPQTQGRVFVGQAAWCGRAGLPNDGAQTPLVGALALLCAAVAIPLFLRDPGQVCAVGVRSAVAACNQ